MSTETDRGESFAETALKLGGKSDEEARRMEPRKVFVDTQNRIKRIEVGDGFAHHPRPAATPRELSLAGSH